MVTTDNRFLKTKSGSIYSTAVCDYNFWKRYLQVFDEVLVFARVADILQEELNRPPANGPNVRFIGLPAFIGPWQYLKQYRRLNALAKQAVEQADAFILRIPGTVDSLLWHQLKNRGIPYGVEVVGDLWDSLSVLSVKSILTPIATYQMARNQKKQCRGAIAAAYVSEHYIQRRHPPGGWSTHYSSIELPDEAIIKENDLAAHLASIHNAISGKRPLRICHMGTMATLYKGQDVLIEAVSLCTKKGRDIKLTLLDDGRYYQYYLNKVKKLGLEKYVEFLGQLPPGKAVIEQLDAADLFVLPSFVEGLPRSLIEAMARGLPCLASNVGGIPELLVDEDLFSRGNADILAEKIDSLFTDWGKIEEMAWRNLQTARKYSADKLNQRRRALYQKLKEKTEEWYSKGYQK